MQTKRLDKLLLMLEIQPNDSFLIYAIALEYLAEGQEEKAKSSFETLLKEHPDYLPVYYQAGIFYADRGEEDKALELFKKGMELAKAKNDIKTYNELKEMLESYE